MLLAVGWTVDWRRRVQAPHMSHAHSNLLHMQASGSEHSVGCLLTLLSISAMYVEAVAAAFSTCSGFIVAPQTLLCTGYGQPAGGHLVVFPRDIPRQPPDAGELVAVPPHNRPLHDVALQPPRRDGIRACSGLMGQNTSAHAHAAHQRQHAHSEAGFAVL